MIARLLLLLAVTYRLAEPGYVFEFPRDHGSHPEYKLEWWYWTGHLDAEDGRTFGYQLTFFRTGLEQRPENPSRWAVHHLHIAHFALTDLDAGRHFHFEKLNREGPGIAGARSGRLEVWNENWMARLEGGKIRLEASAGDIDLQLLLSPLKLPVIHGQEGFSRKAEGEGRGSHYYSFTRLATQGRLTYQGKELAVRGESWMDREFGTNQLAEDQVGWDWFGLQLDGGEELMLFEIRRRDGSVDPHSAGTAVSESGEGTHLAAGDFTMEARREWKSPRSGAVYPLDWRIRIPSLEADLRVIPLLDDQELVTTRSTGVIYWEGAVRVEGTWRGRQVTGRGYAELTGYAEDFRPRI